MSIASFSSAPLRDRRVLAHRSREPVRPGDNAASVDRSDTLADANETALREVNHRAKNSIATAISLLRLQSRRQAQPEVTEALDEAIQRLHHLARIHDILARLDSGNAQRIDMTVYLAELCGHYVHLRPPGVAIELAPNNAKIELDSGRAINAALLAGEAISNALKHAFPGGRSGVIRLALQSEGEDVVLTIEDDGVGFELKRSETAMGMRLMAELARTLGGGLRITRDGTTHVELRFPQADSAGVPKKRRSRRALRRPVFKLERASS